MESSLKEKKYERVTSQPVSVPKYLPGQTITNYILQSETFPSEIPEQQPHPIELRSSVSGRGFKEQGTAFLLGWVWCSGQWKLVTQLV